MADNRLACKGACRNLGAMSGFMDYLPLIALIAAATIAKGSLHREMRQLSRPQMEAYSRAFLSGRLWQLGAMMAILLIVFYVTSGSVDRNTALLLLAAAGLGVLVWVPWTLISANRTLKGLQLPDGFRRAVVLDKGVQGFLAGLLIAYGAFRMLGGQPI